MKLKLEEFKEYKEQIEKSLKIALMSVYTDEVILKYLNKRIEKLNKEETNKKKFKQT